MPSPTLFILHTKAMLTYSVLKRGGVVNSHNRVVSLQVECLRKGQADHSPRPGPKEHASTIRWHEAATGKDRLTRILYN